MSDQLSTAKRALIEIRELRARLEAAEGRAREPIAIVGMGVRLPGGVETVDEFWRLLSEGRDVIREVPADRWPIDQFYDRDASAPGKMSTRFGGFLERPDLFDARFFGVSPREASTMDPQQRLLLEVAWEALEHGGQAPDQLNGHPTGVFVGMCAFDYLIAEMKSTPYAAIDPYLASGGAPSVASGRLSFMLGLRGPSLTIDTACSSSLTAVHLACQSLRAGDCTMALAGGVNLILLPEFLINLSKAGMMAADGRCKTFDAAADGYVRSEGCAVVVLKRLSDAVANRDRVLAVIRGSAVNQDGRTSGLTVPNGPAQEQVITEALARAGVAPAQVGYVEAHGTGTSLGDPIELRALANVYGQRRDAASPLVVGSVKTNLGHLESAAGVTGLIKLVLSLQHRAIPPHLHFTTPTPRVPWNELPLLVPSTAIEWRDTGSERIGGVSSFGFSGTNAHVIVAEGPAPTAAPASSDRTWHVLTLSAKTNRALAALAERWAGHLAATEQRVADICFTANAGRAHFAHRAAIVARSVEDLRQGLANVVAQKQADNLWQGEVRPGAAADVAFVFPAALSSTTSLAVLRAEQPSFREALERCLAIAEARTGHRITDGELDNVQESSAERRPVITWALQVALAEMWLAWGIRPRFVTGDGRGAVVAAQVAGAISDRDAFELVSGHAVAPAQIGEMRYAMVGSGGFVSPRDLQSVAFWRGSEGDAAQALRHITSHGVELILRFGPAHAGPDAASGGTFTAIAADKAADAHALTVLAQFYVRGAGVAWEDFDRPFPRARVALPTYPFQREPHWSEFITPAATNAAAGAVVEANSGWVSEVVWRPHSVAGRPPSAVRRVSIVADQGAMADAVARKLHARNVGATIVRGDDRVETLHSDAVLMLHALDVAAHDSSSGALVQAAIVGACDRLVGVVRALSSGAATPLPRLLTVSRGAYAVGNEGAVAVAQAPVAALAAVIAAEHPDLGSTAIDVDPSADADAAADTIVNELLFGERRETRVAYRDGTRFVARLAPAAPCRCAPISARADATYLITGGAGALGLHVAGALIDSGARHLVLVGRRAPTGALTAALRAWADRGCDVRYMSGDVADDQFVDGLLGHIGATLPPLAGICHTAGVLDDGVLLQQNAERFSRVMTPKVAGAWNLHRAAAAMPLDFFVMFSSLASIVGTAGQGNYAAANAFLDALACERRRQGQAATSIAWGPWDESGMAAAAGGASQRRWASRGLGRIDAASGVALFRALSGKDAGPVPVVAPIDWRTYLDSRPVDERPALLDEMASPVEATVATAVVETSLGSRLQALEPAEQHAALMAIAREQLVRVLGLPPEERVDPRQGLLDLGVDSLMALELRNAIQRVVGQTLPATFTFDHPTLDAMATDLRRRLVAAPERPAADAMPQPAGAAFTNEPIAIVGLGCRMPGGVDSPEAFWRLLREGGDAITTVPASRWNVDEYYDPDPQAAGKMVTRRGGFVRDAELFDPQFFGIAPREATTMDPQQRLLLEVAWEACEDAGLPLDRLHGSRTGVFVGISTNEYVQLQLRRTHLSELEGHVGTGGAPSVAAGRLSYSLGLQGPAMAVDTACSSSLVAIHLACQSLRQRECETALAGGVNMILAPEGNVILSRARMLSPEGRCKTFDAAADGYVRSEGCGVVVLKRLSDAVASGDRVLAVIRGTAVNQDGRSGGLTVPNGPAQESLIRSALAAAGMQPADIDYIEAHGTGTSLGDPIEVRALGNVFGEGRNPERPLLIGSVKTNVGHLEPAAGIAGLIKVVLSLTRGEIPPHLHLTSVNPLIALDAIPAAIPTALTPWIAAGRPRRAGLSSFGFSGTNAHAVIEEAPMPAPPAADGRTHHVLALSAKTPEALRELATRYAERLDRTSETLSDIAFTANTGRSHFERRVAVTGATIGDVSAALRSRAPGITDEAAADRPRVAFLYTGQGAQYPGMARELYASQPAFRRALDRCAELLDAELRVPLLDVLFDRQPGAALVDRTEFTQPALFAIEHALTEMWREWGVQPAAVMGHSVGEFAAACAAGVLTLEDAAHLVAVRGRLMQALPDGGAMAAVFTSEAQVRDLIAPVADQVAIAAVNAADHTVIAGAAARVAELCQRLQSRGVESRQLVVSHAFHSPLMAPMLDEFARAAERVTVREPRLPLISNVTGRRLQTHERCDGAYWRAHAAQPVQFASGMRALADEGCSVFLEVGPNPTLIGMGRRTITDDSVKWLPSLRKGRSDWQQVLETVAVLYESSAELNWRAIEPAAGRRIVTVPTYPFQRERYWIADAPAGPEPSRTGPTDRWTTEHAYTVAWQRRAATAAQPETSAGTGTWIVLVDEQEFGSAISGELRARGVRCVEVRAGAATVQDGADRWQVAADQRDGFAHVFSQLAGVAVTNVVDCWPLDAPAIDHASPADMEAAQVKTCGAILHLSQVLRSLAVSPRLWVVTREAVAVRPDERPSGVLQSTAWGFGRVVALEHPEIWGGLIDIDTAGASNAAASILALIDAADGEDQAAIRAGELYVPRLMPTPSMTAPPVPMHRDATYLVTGGTGNLGLRIAAEMARQGAGHLVLVSRSAQLATAQAAAIQDIEAIGARVTVWQGDVTREPDMERLGAALLSWPPLRGVVHAAAHIDARLLKDLQLADVLQMLRPKVAGTAALERATRGAPLDFFVMFSSSAGVFGAIASAHYAAANVFLDSFAHLRRSAGLPATSVSWGTWDVIRGSAEDLEKINRGGMKSLPTPAALAAFVRLLQPSSPHVVFASVDWQTLKPLYESKRRRPFFALVGDRAAAAPAPSPMSPTPLHEQLREARPAERRSLLQAHVREMAGAVLGLRPSQVDVKKGLFDLGMDSLMSVDLRDRLEATVGQKLPATLTFNYPSVAAIAEFIAASVLRLADADAPAAEATPSAAQGVPDGVDELSEDELVSLLAARLEQIPS